jgi:hypothetical protein
LHQQVDQVAQKLTEVGNRLEECLIMAAKIIGCAEVSVKLLRNGVRALSLLALAVTALAVGHTPVIGRVLSVLWRMVGV